MLAMQALEAPLVGSGPIGQAARREAMARFDAPRLRSWQNCSVTTSGRRPG
jgi:hypothetical protein